MTSHSPFTGELAKVRALGAAKDGVHHWWMQRVTALALIPLSGWFIYNLLLLVTSADLPHVAEWLAAPFPAIAMLLLMSAMFYHAKLGMQVIIEDYAHSHKVKIALLLVNSAAMWVLWLMSVMAVIKLHFLDVVTQGV